MIDLVPKEEKEALTAQAVAAEPNQFVMSMDMEDWQVIYTMIYLRIKLTFVFSSLNCHWLYGH